MAQTTARRERKAPKAEVEQLPLRVAIENVRPQINCGRFPIKRTVGESVQPSADVFADGHDIVHAAVRYRFAGESEWQEKPMEHCGNDLFSGSFFVDRVGVYEYTVIGWIDKFESLQRDLSKKWAADQDVSTEILEAAEHILSASSRARGEDGRWLRKQAVLLKDALELPVKIEIINGPVLASLMSRYVDRSNATIFSPTLHVIVETERARFSAWYEMFPRSCTKDPNRHGTFSECEKRIPYIAEMGFDVLYLPPIHPIGTTHRKGRNNSLQALSDDPGSPWGIGSSEGGHKAIHPELGTLADFSRFVAAANNAGMEIALDLAFQCSPDHPYVREHPEWFRHRPDGSIKYAENPPKKYQDIFPLDFEGEGWQTLWQELKSVVEFWIDRGIHIFRVDNPHTKTFAFWEWLISQIRRDHPEVIFLSEAFTRPKVMKHLAKCGFSQSYTYFTWRNTKQELTLYFEELTSSETREYLRANLFVNTPDILHEYLQFGKRPAFQSRLVLAATLGSSYGIYGPAFELCESNAVPGTEEYHDSEKYQIRVWDLNNRNNLKDFIAAVNRIRKENTALQFAGPVRFYETTNDQLICYSKTAPDLSNTMLIVVNLDPHHKQAGWVRLSAEELNLAITGNYQVHDLLTGSRYLWQGETNYVELDPFVCPAHIFRVRRKIKTEKDFDYYL